MIAHPVAELQYRSSEDGRWLVDCRNSLFFPRGQVTSECASERFLDHRVQDSSSFCEGDTIVRRRQLFWKVTGDWGGGHGLKSGVGGFRASVLANPRIEQEETEGAEEGVGNAREGAERVESSRVARPFSQRIVMLPAR
jgi:hypothetical protein